MNIFTLIHFQFLFFYYLTFEQHLYLISILDYL